MTRLLPFSPLRLIAALVFLLILTASADARAISVALSKNSPSLSISSSSAVTATDAGGRRHSLGTSPVFRTSGKGSVKAGSSVLRLPVTLSAKNLLTFNGRRYRGSLRLLSAGSGITLVNVLELEDYLRGVLKNEVSPAWPLEALKAQAIVSRTYALRSISMNGGKGGYDLGDSYLSQVYRGINAEDKRTDKAIALTKGIVVLAGGSLAFTPFHSDSGGATADVSTVWGSSLPYLKGVCETVPSASPNSSWEVRLSSAAVEAALRDANADVGTLQELRIGECDPFGRVNTLVAVGSRGSRTLKSHSFRMAAGSKVIRSTTFSIHPPKGGILPAISVPAAKAPPSNPSRLSPADVPTSNTPMSAAEEAQLTALTEQSAFNGEELMDMLLHPEKRKGYLVRALRTQRPAAPSAPQPSLSSGTGDYVFRGKGWGHGVGLSQWGTKALAEQGWDHRKILAFYFPGTALGSR
ncbi:MAG: SpoIID/LytB domain-containing protein [Synergistaceae bacterium]|nr:SpoIID/LytB domain-containing protein [Synergistaceae bacterium]